MNLPSVFWKQAGRFCVPVVLIEAWEAFSRSGYLPPSLLPAPSQVLWTWADWLFAIDESTQNNTGHWCVDALASGVRVLGGYGIAAVSGISIGIAIGWWRWVERTVEPTIQASPPDSSRLMDPACHHMVRHRQPARDFSRFSRHLLPCADEFHPRRKDD
jgi:ABC-type nitrate/sulfonate/bicarbonate transport system permease component